MLSLSLSPLRLLLCLLCLLLSRVSSLIIKILSPLGSDMTLQAHLLRSLALCLLPLTTLVLGTLTVVPEFRDRSPLSLLLAVVFRKLPVSNSMDVKIGEYLADNG